jgi:outer membrane autotransporter protein
MIVTPTVSAAYTYINTASFSETGTGATERNSADAQSALDLGVGVNVAWKLKNSDGSIMKPALRAGYAYDLIGDAVQVNSSFTGDPAATVFKTKGPDPARNIFNVGAGLTYMTTADWDLSANYDYQYKEDYSAHYGVVRATSHF